MSNNRPPSIVFKHFLLTTALLQRQARRQKHGANMLPAMYYSGMFEVYESRFFGLYWCKHSWRLVLKTGHPSYSNLLNRRKVQRTGWLNHRNSGHFTTRFVAIHRRLSPISRLIVHLTVIEKGVCSLLIGSTGAAAVKEAKINTSWWIYYSCYLSIQPVSAVTPCINHVV